LEEYQYSKYGNTKVASYSSARETCSSMYGAPLQQSLTVVYYSVAEPEPEPQGAASFGRSRSRNAMRLRLRQWYLSWLGI
jgi:hypothetical protein